MNIVQAIETSGPGGAEQVLIQLSSRLQAAGHLVQAVLLRDGWLKDQLESKGVRVTIIPLASPWDRAFLRRLRRTIAEFHTSVFHSHEITLGAYGRLATRSLSVAHVATAHGENFSGNVKRKLICRTLFRRSPGFRFVTVSEHLARRISIPRSAIEIIRNGVELPRGHVPAPRAAGEPLRLVAVGNLYPVKNHELLIRAVAELVQRGVEAHLEIIGRGSEEAKLNSTIQELGMADRVTLRGYRSDVRSFLATAHVFVSASLSEGMPLSFLEAMGTGLPIVAPRVGGIPEIVDSEVHGLLFEPERLDALVDAIQRLAMDDGLRQELGTRAAQRAQGQFSVDGMINNYERLYDHLVHSDGRHANRRVRDDQ